VKRKILWPVALILIFALSRWPGAMPQNFSAAYALCFCAGLYLPRRWAWTLPLSVMLVTDLALTFLYYHPVDYSVVAFVRDQALNYAAYAMLIGLGCASSFWICSVLASCVAIVCAAVLSCAHETSAADSVLESC